MKQPFAELPGSTRELAERMSQQRRVERWAALQAAGGAMQVFWHEGRARIADARKAEARFLSIDADEHT